MLCILPATFAIDASVINVNPIQTPPLYPQQQIDFRIQLATDTNNIVGALTASADGTQFYSGVATALISGNYYTITWNPNTLPINAGNHTIQVTFNISGDTNVLNNTKLINITVNTQSGAGIDLQPTDINYGTFTANHDTQICFKVQNNGDSTATAAYLKVWHTSQVPASLIYLNQVTLTAQQIQQYCFNYKPLSAGTDLLIFSVDPDNLITESNESNNSTQKMITVNADVNASGETAYSLFFDIRSGCYAIIGNGDKFISEGIDTNVLDVNNPNPTYKLKFLLIDGQGNTIMQDNQPAGYQIVTTGRTFKIISITKTVARAMLIYPQQYQVYQNTCEVNVEDLQNRYDNLLQDFQRIQVTLTEAQTKQRIAEQDSSTCHTTLVQSQGEGLNCISNLSNISTNLGLCNDSCMKSQNDLRNQCESDKNTLLFASNREIKDKQDLAYAGWGLFFFVIIICGVAMIMIKRQHILENKMHD